MKIGLIAGGGQFPLLFSNEAIKLGFEVYSVAFTNEADQNLNNYVTSIEWLHLGQVNKLIKFFKKNSVTDAVMLGTVKKTNIFKDIKPDLKALSFIASLVKTHDDSVLSSFANFLEKQGINIKPSTFLLPDLLCTKGCWTKIKPDKDILKDIQEGWKIAKQIGSLDIGQSIVISNGTVLAVEAADGTDATIKRGAKLSKKNGAIVIKVSKPQQDLRFDLPSIGCQTIQIMHESGANVLVLEADKCIAFDKDEMIKMADEFKISILVMDDNEIK